jgi:hypothetical protein
MIVVYRLAMLTILGGPAGKTLTTQMTRTTAYLQATISQDSPQIAPFTRMAQRIYSCRPRWRLGCSCLLTRQIAPDAPSGLGIVLQSATSATPNHIHRFDSFYLCNWDARVNVNESAS